MFALNIWCKHTAAGKSRETDGTVAFPSSPKHQDGELLLSSKYKHPECSETILAKIK